ncbi:hypothetical protein MPSEU_000637800 [Mayamaea pseudoterrestris]|nr:hypothetical protein MPSEU_000637800 [Mayamaea pseudoterrestris]
MTNIPLVEPSFEERLDACTATFAFDAMIAEDCQKSTNDSTKNKSTFDDLNSSKRSFETTSKAQEFSHQPATMNDSHHVPSLERLTYHALLRDGNGRIMSSSMPVLNYTHNDQEEELQDEEQDRGKWIANILKQVPQSPEEAACNDSNDCNMLHNEATAEAYGYGDEGGGRSFSVHDAVNLDSSAKRRRVMRRNSFVIPRGRGLVPGLLDLQDAGKFHFGASEEKET